MWHTFSAPSFTQDKHQKEQLIIQQSLLSAGAVLGTADSDDEKTAKYSTVLIDEKLKTQQQKQTYFAS